MEPQAFLFVVAHPRSDASARARGNEAFHLRIRCANKVYRGVDVAEL
jgi:hypothetical protein